MLNEKKVGFIDGGLSRVPQRVSAKVTTCVEGDRNSNVTTSVRGYASSKDGFYKRNDYPKSVINTKGGL